MKMTDIIPMGFQSKAPPVNNACMPDIYNKLDADTIEKTRVVNALLDVKLRVQEKVLSKYKTAAERTYSKERARMKSELKSIARRLPNYSDIPNLETKVKKLKRRRRSNNGPKHNCVFTTQPKEIKGIPAEKDDRPFCDRYFSHHLPTKMKMYKDVLPAVRKGMSLPDLRPRPQGQILVPRGTHVLERDDRVTKNVFPAIHSLDDNFIASKSYLWDDDDSKTV